VDISLLTKRPATVAASLVLHLQIYNLTFTAIVGITVFFILRYISPLAAWIIRTLAILFGFGSTLCFQFLPKIWYVVIVNRCRKPENSNVIGSFGSESDRQSAASASTW